MLQIILNGENVVAGCNQQLWIYEENHSLFVIYNSLFVLNVLRLRYVVSVAFS